MIKIIQISDLHLIPAGARLHGLDPRARLMTCIEEIASQHADAAMLVASGDLTDSGQPEAYAVLRECLSMLKMPCHLLIGNHDDRANFRRAFPEAPSDANGYIQSVVDTPAGRLVLLDTTEAGHSWGAFCECRARWLGEQLAADGPVFLFMHHPPFSIGIPSLDDIRLLQPQLFTQAIGPAKQVRHIFLGHVHRPISGSWRGIPWSMVRATAHQVAGDFKTRGPLPYSFDAPGYAVILLHDDSVVVHQQECIGQRRQADAVHFVKAAP